MELLIAYSFLTSFCLPAHKGYMFDIEHIMRALHPEVFPNRSLCAQFVKVTSLAQVLGERTFSAKKYLKNYFLQE